MLNEVDIVPVFFQARMAFYSIIKHISCVEVSLSWIWGERGLERALAGLIARLKLTIKLTFIQSVKATIVLNRQM